MGIKSKKAGTTHIVMLVDRSGSMDQIKSDMEGAINLYVKEQQAFDGECTFTFAQFDDHYEVLRDAADLQTIGKVTIEPRGSTALLDAMGTTLRAAQSYVEGLSTPPEHKLVTIITDGLENASRDWTRQRVFNLVKKMEEQGWVIVYLGANQDAIAEGGRFGTHSGTTMTYDSTHEGVANMMATHTLNTTALRSRGSYGEFNDEDREAASSVVTRT
jgi:hypothetical protein